MEIKNNRAEENQEGAVHVQGQDTSSGDGTIEGGIVMAVQTMASGSDRIAGASVAEPGTEFVDPDPVGPNYKKRPNKVETKPVAKPGEEFVDPDPVGPNYKKRPDKVETKPAVQPGAEFVDPDPVGPK